MSMKCGALMVFRPCDPAKGGRCCRVCELICHSFNLAWPKRG
jgi:hypothetical protein